MGKDKYKCCCKDKHHEKHCCSEKKCHHEGHSNHPCEGSCMRRRCCRCGCYCNMIYFKKYKGYCKFIYKCQCGYCFEYICDSRNNHCYERESCCHDKDNKVKAKICCIDKTCHKKKTCGHNGTKNNNCCKCR